MLTLTALVVILQQYCIYIFCIGHRFPVHAAKASISTCSAKIASPVVTVRATRDLGDALKRTLNHPDTRRRRRHARFTVSALTEWTKQLVPSAFCPRLRPRPTSWLETAASD